MTAVLVAYKLLHRNLPSGKSLPYLTWWYAINIVKGKWEEAEPFILTDPEASCLYAASVLKTPWGEVTIRSSPEWSQKYDDWLQRGVSPLIGFTTTANVAGTPTAPPGTIAGFDMNTLLKGAAMIAIATLFNRKE